jgi:glucose-1-phosphate cytidylyltransferase
MKVVILAGGRGTRLSEETTLKPKPMVEIGGLPILWHIMRMYASCGMTDFVVCLGYKGYVIKEYFANYFLHTRDVTFELRTGAMEVHASTAEDWRVTLVDTGEDAGTGGRLAKVMPYVGDETFCFTYGDGLADLDLSAVVDFHRRNGRLSTVTAVQPPGRFGALEMDGDRAVSFEEKPRGDGAWSNGGFFVLEPAAVDFVDDEATMWEQRPMRELAARGEMAVYRHEGFWQAMDTLRDRNILEDLWERGEAPWNRASRAPLQS